MRDNEASEGGGLANVGGTLTVERSTITDNHARRATSGARGGAFALIDGTTSISNSTISGNSADNAESDIAQGGGIYVGGPGLLDIRGSTIAGNEAPFGGAIAGNPNAQADVPVNGTIIDGAAPFTCQSVDIQGSRNVVDDSSCGGPVVNPQLGPLQDNGGPTDTHALAAGSPAVDAGSGCDETDQRGRTRIRACDIGAFELDGARMVSLTADGDDGECTPQHCTLREAISRDTAAEIHLTDNEYDLASPLIVDRSVTIRGIEDDLATIQADSETTERAMIVAPGVAVELFRLQIRGGNEVAGDGGGIYVPANASAAVTDSLISGNFARHGGGIWAEGSLSLVRTSVAGNEAIGDGPSELGRGGGVHLADGAAPATFTNTTFSGNLATGRGGGIYTQRSMSLRNVSIVENEAPARSAPPAGIGKGAGLYQDFQSGDLTTAANTLLARHENGACGGTEFFQIAASNSLLDEPLPNTTCNAPQIPSNLLVPDALVGPLDENRGLTPNHALLDESPAIGAGANCQGDDQRGFPRPAGAGCDIGAVEFEAEELVPEVSVRSDELTQPGCTVDHCTLRERLELAEDDNTIALGTGTYELTAGEPLDLDFPLRIDGAGAGSTTIDANGTSRVGYVDGSTSVTITRVTVTGGYADAGDNEVPRSGRSVPRRAEQRAPARADDAHRQPSVGDGRRRLELGRPRYPRVDDLRQPGRGWSLGARRRRLLDR